MSFSNRCLSSVVVFACVFVAGDLAAGGPGASTGDGVSLEAIRPFARFLNEVSERRRRVVYIPNQQSIFHGVQVGLVNVGRGNLSFARRDVVTVGRRPVVFARVYDSAARGSGDFGAGGWRLGLAESIQLAPDGSLSLTGETGTVARFVRRGKAYRLEMPHPSDIESVRIASPEQIVVALRNGTRKRYELLAGRHRLVAVRDRNGNTLELAYRGRHLSQIRAGAGRGIVLERDGTGRIRAVRDDQGRTVRYAYDGDGRLYRVIDLGGNAWHYEYDTAGRLTTALGPLGHVDVSASYDAAGRVTATRVRGELVRFEYDARERHTRVTDAAGRVSEFSQNAAGITVACINPAGTRTTVTLDPENRVTALYREGEAAVRYRYGPNGRLKSLVRLDRSTPRRFTYEYDEGGRLTRIGSDAAGPVLSLSYDGAGNLVRTDSAAGRTLYGYGGNGALESIRRADGTAHFFANDADGQIVAVRDQLDRTTHLSYSTAGRLTGLRLHNGHWQQYAYDPLGTRDRALAPDGVHIDYHYDAAGSLFRFERHARDGRVMATNYVVDDEKRLIRITGDAVRASIEYAASGEAAALRWDQGEMAFAYDELGRLTQVASADESIRYTYLPGEPDIRVQLDRYTRVGLAGRIDTGSVIGSDWELLRNRTRAAPYEHVYFDSGMGELRMLTDHGVVVPGALVEDSLLRMRLLGHAGGSPQVSHFFSAPSNVLFIPAEFWAINCNTCPPLDPRGTPVAPAGLHDDLQAFGASIAACPPDSDPPPRQTITLENVYLGQASLLTLTFKVSAGTLPSARLDGIGPRQMRYNVSNLFSFSVDPRQAPLGFPVPLVMTPSDGPAITVTVRHQAEDRSDTEVMFGRIAIQEGIPQLAFNQTLIERYRSITVTSSLPAERLLYGGDSTFQHLNNIGPALPRVPTNWTVQHWYSNGVRGTHQRKYMSGVSGPSIGPTGPVIKLKQVTSSFEYEANETSTGVAKTLTMSLEDPAGPVLVFGLINPATDVAVQ